MSPVSIDLHHAREVAVDAAQAAGALLRTRSRDGFRSWAKGPAGDVVTELDVAAEELLVDLLRQAFPRHGFRCEEAGARRGDPAGGEEWTWWIDPLDGTNNVAIGIAAYVVGLALCSAGGTAVGGTAVAVVHDPVSAGTWSAVRGGGATGPAGPLSARPRPTPHGPVLAWTQGHHVPRSDPFACALKLALEQHSRRVLQLWAPLACWVMLARGDIDGFVGYRPEAIELPAGSLLARESGIAVVDFDGAPFDEHAGAAPASFVAGHESRIAELLGLVRSAERLRSGLDQLLPAVAPPLAVTTPGSVPG